MENENGMNNGMRKVHVRVAYDARIVKVENENGMNNGMRKVHACVAYDVIVNECECVHY